jgi:hypothetical protein
VENAAAMEIDAFGHILLMISTSFGKTCAKRSGFPTFTTAPAAAT